MTTPTQRPASHSEGRKRAVERLDSHEHAWSRRQNVTTKGTAMPPYEVCGCGAARQVDEPTPTEPDTNERERNIDYHLVFRIIASDPSPAEALRSFVAQEIEAATSRTLDARLAACSRCGDTKVHNPRPTADLVTCQRCAYEEGREAAVASRLAAAKAEALMDPIGPFEMGGFEGCTDRDPDLCACGTDVQPTCEDCGEEIAPGDMAWQRSWPSINTLPLKHERQAWEIISWHDDCDAARAARLREQGADPDAALRAGLAGWGVEG